MHQCVAPPRPLGQRINIDIDNVSAICQPEPLLKYLLPMTNSGTNNKKANGVKRSMQRGAIHADVNHHAAHYFYDQVLINQPTDLNFAVETDSDWCGMGDRSVVVVSGEQQIKAADGRLNPATWDPARSANCGLGNTLQSRSRCLAAVSAILASSSGRKQAISCYPLTSD
jgi:hypothetical protein